MQGKILANGLISGNDGLRYTFKPEDVKNVPENSSIEALIGAEVDFEGRDGVASGVYITKKAFGVANVSAVASELFSVKPAGLPKVKLQLYAMVACVVLSVFMPLGFVFKVAALVFGFLATKELQNMSGSRALLKKFVALFVLMWITISFSGALSSALNMKIPLVSGGGMGLGFSSVTRGFFATSANATMLGFGAAAGAISFVGFLIMFALTCPVLRSYIKELTYITKQEQYLKYTFWATILGLIVPGVGFLLIIAALFFYVKAWIQTTKIEKSYSAKGYKKTEKAEK